MRILLQDRYVNPSSNCLFFYSSFLEQLELTKDLFGQRSAARTCKSSKTAAPLFFKSSSTLVTHDFDVYAFFLVFFLAAGRFAHNSLVMWKRSHR